MAKLTVDVEILLDTQMRDERCEMRDERREMRDER